MPPSSCKTVKELRRRIAARVDAGDAVFGLEQLRQRFKLDDEDLDILLHIAGTTLDPQLGKLHTKLSGVAHRPWLDVGLAILVHHDSVSDRLRSRARFQPSAPLPAPPDRLDRARPRRATTSSPVS